MRTSSVVKSPLTSRQQREFSAARKTLGEAADVRAFGTGRANACWSERASWVVIIFVVVFGVVLVLFHAILFPGVIVVYALYDSVKPRRGVAVTGAGVAELRLSMVNGRAVSLLGTTDHGALFEPRLERVNGKGQVRFGAERVSLRDADLTRLQGPFPSTDVLTVQRTAGALPPPPVPRPDAPARLDTAGATPRWREATALWVVVHIVVGLGLFLGIIAASNGVGSAFGRDTSHTSASADIYLWVIFAGAIAGWMLFVYQRRSTRARTLLLCAFTGGALLLASIVNLAYSPITH